jgi:RNA recognition motif-containing protein
MCPNSLWDDDLATPPDNDEERIIRDDSFHKLEQQAEFMALELIGETVQEIELKPRRVKFELRSYPNELESRTVLVSNLPPDTTEAALMENGGLFGDVQSVSITKINRGLASINFYDLRSAYYLRASSMRIGGRQCFLAFGPREIEADSCGVMNNGTIVVFKIGTGVEDEVVEQVFETFGDVREVRRSPGKEHQRFVEFWDKRSAQKAFEQMNHKFVSGLKGKVVIDFSRPGGFRAKVTQLPGNHVPSIERRSAATKNELLLSLAK